MVDWIRAVIRFRQGPRGPAPVATGLEECRRDQTALVGEIAQPGWRPADFENGPASVVFLELIAPTAEREEAARRAAAEHVARSSGQMWRPGLSPHAPYTVPPAFFGELVAMARRYGLPIAFHIAESREELQLLRDGSGPFRPFLEAIPGWRGDAIPRRSRPLDYLRAAAEAPRALAIHGNYLDDEEVAFLAANARRVSLVHCPRTHARFGHERFPLDRMLASGVRVAIGTDSRASSPDLSMLAEWRFLVQTHPTIAPAKLLELTTLAGAEALGEAERYGSLAPGKSATMAVLPLSDGDLRDPYEAILRSLDYQE